jgi:hypothetical protein
MNFERAITLIFGAALFIIAVAFLWKVVEKFL